MFCTFTSFGTQNICTKYCVILSISRSNLSIGMSETCRSECSLHDWLFAVHNKLYAKIRRLHDNHFANSRISFWNKIQPASLCYIDRILPACNYCHHPWCVGDKCYHKALIIMFSWDGLSDHASWNEVCHYWDTRLSWEIPLVTQYIF